MISLKGFALAQTWNEDAMDLSYDADSTSRQEDELEIDLDLTDGNLQDVRDEDMVEGLADFHPSSSQQRHGNVLDDNDFAIDRGIPESEQSTSDHSEVTGMVAAQFSEDVNDQDQGEVEDVIVDDLFDETEDAAGTLKDVEGVGIISGSSAPRDDFEEPDTEIPAPLEQLHTKGTSQVANGHILLTDLLTHDLDNHYQEDDISAGLQRGDERSFEATRLRSPETTQVSGVDFQGSDGLTAFDSIPSAPQSSAESSSSTILSPPKSPAQRAPISIPIHVTYQETEMSLFPSFDPDQDQAQTYLLEDDSLLHQQIKTLMQACRSVLGDSIPADDELVLSLPELDLHITEPSTIEMDISLLDVVELLVQLHANGDREETPSLYMNLTSRPNPFNRWNHLKAAVHEGKGISNIQMDNPFPHDNTEFFPVHDIGGSAISKADGISSDKDERRPNHHGNKSGSSDAIGEIVDENIYLDSVEDVPIHGHSDDYLKNEGSTRTSNNAAAYMEARRTSTSTHDEAVTSFSQKPHPQSYRDDGSKQEDTPDQDSIQRSRNSPQSPLLEDEGSLKQTNGRNKMVSDEASNHWADEDRYAAEYMVQQGYERTKAVYSNPTEIEDLDDWDEEEDQKAATDDFGDASSSIPLTKSHEIVTKITNSGDDQFSVNDENTDGHESVFVGQRPTHSLPGYMMQDHEALQTYGAGSADDTLPQENKTPMGMPGAAISTLMDDEHHEDASEPFVDGPMGSGNVDTVTFGGSSTAVTANEAGEVTKSAGLEDAKDTVPSNFLDVAASDEDGTILDDEKLPGDILNHSTSDNPPASASSLLKRPRNASEDETPTGADLHDVKRARSSQKLKE